MWNTSIFIEGESINQTNPCLSWNFTELQSIWHTKLDSLAITQLSLNIFGIIGNSLLIGLFGRHSMGSRLSTILLQSQAIFDLLVNFHAIWFGFFGQIWNLPNKAINSLVCYLWHSQFTYWLCVQLSIGNLVLIGLERFVAITHPIVYQKLRLSKVAIYLVGFNLFYNFILASPNVLDTVMEQNCCQNQFSDKFRHFILKVHSICWFIFVYLLALTLLLYFYGNIIRTLRRSVLFNPTQQRTNETLRFTRMAFVITTVYLLCVSYDAFAYLIGRSSSKNFPYESTWQKLGMFFVSLNSLANPYIYFCLVLKESWTRKFHAFNQTTFYRSYQHRNPV